MLQTQASRDWRWLVERKGACGAFGAREASRFKKRMWGHAREVHVDVSVPKAAGEDQLWR